MRPWGERRGAGPGIVLAALLLLAVPAGVVPGDGAARAAAGVRLIMVDDPNCHYCRKWNAEIGRGYARSAEGRFAPLKRVRRGAREIKGFAPAIFTPTFIVVRQGREVGRISGYPGRDYFYPELRSVLAQVGFVAR